MAGALAARQLTDKLPPDDQPVPKPGKANLQANFKHYIGALVIDYTKPDQPESFLRRRALPARRAYSSTGATP
ncbi:hypothetical protein [Paludibacterium sp. B53371]|uniref:hypothetical protein n=1 Tax=Paludibacterium sp. B53371 TaxID=2806263 RepID=UPI001C059894|nr:hypothetical protein [Paludibacterium sp. B53371]